METTQHHIKLVEQRSAIHRTLADMYGFLSRNRDILSRMPKERSLLGLLIGAAYSLWRAAFLTDADRSWPMILKRAEDVLQRLVEDNAIGYPQDKDTRDWMVGYYLNNARYRMVRVRQKIAEDASLRSLADIPEFQAFDDVQRSGGVDETETHAVWDKTHHALVATLARFKEHTQLS